MPAFTSKYWMTNFRVRVFLDKKRKGTISWILACRLSSSASRTISNIIKFKVLINIDHLPRSFIQSFFQWPIKLDQFILLFAEQRVAWLKKIILTSSSFYKSVSNKSFSILPNVSQQICKCNWNVNRTHTRSDKLLVCHKYVLRFNIQVINFESQYC